MDKITQEFLDELMVTQEKFNDMVNDLCIYINQLEDWEEKNLGIKSCSEVGYDNLSVEIEDGKVCICTVGEPRDWEQLGYEKYYQTYPLDKLFSNEWREAALEKHHKELEIKRQEEEAVNAELEKILEKEERAEYERLKAKFG